MKNKKKLGFPQYVRDNMFLIMKHELQKGDQEDWKCKAMIYYFELAGANDKKELCRLTTFKVFKVPGSEAIFPGTSGSFSAEISTGSIWTVLILGSFEPLGKNTNTNIPPAANQSLG